MNARQFLGRVRSDKDDPTTRFQWQMLHSSVFGRVQIDVISDSMWLPDLKQMQQDLMNTAYRTRVHPASYFSPVNGSYRGHIDADEAIRQGTPTGTTPKYHGWVWSTGFRWYFKLWEMDGKKYGVAAYKRKDGRYWLSYALFFKK